MRFHRDLYWWKVQHLETQQEGKVPRGCIAVEKSIDDEELVVFFKKSKLA
jgi:hypothetical protein